MDNNNLRHYVFKLALIGDIAVGKTSLIDKYIHNKFREDYRPTLGVNIILKTILIKKLNAAVDLTIWDIAGQDKYETSRKLYFQGCAGALLCYDITRQTTFENIESKWLQDLRNHGKNKSVYIIIGNKMDLEENRVVTTKNGATLAKIIGAQNFYETSAKNGENVEKVFLELVHGILKNHGEI